VIAELAALNDKVNTTEMILPGTMADAVESTWLTFHDKIVAEALRTVTNRPLLATLALSADALADETQIEAVVEYVSRWDVHGFYLVAQAPRYLVDNPNWVANLLILAAGLKLLNRRVVVGYSNHQLLALSASNVDAIASGTWLNVRAFDPSKFYIPGEDDVSRRAIWYYCPQALSEYKVPFLDVARRSGVLASMAPDAALRSDYAAPLFSGAPPTSVNWKDQPAFRHYLTCLNAQVESSGRASFDETLADQRAKLDAAEATTTRLRAAGVFGGDRDFSNVVDVNRSALTLLANARGAQLRRSW
jgi:hypothetical protein